MNYRNPQYNKLGTINCEVDNPHYGWIPFTASPDDSNADGVTLYNQIVSDGGITAYEPPADLTPSKRYARYKVDSAAEEARLRYVTDGAAQAMTYQLKGDEAAAYVTAGYPVDLTAYPFIQAEMTSTGKTKEQAADDIVSQRSAWVTLAVAIEETRLTGKTAVDAAVDEAGVDAARAAAITSLNEI